MIVRCSKCSTEFDLNPQQVGPEGVTLRCSVYSHMFHAEPNPEAGIHEPWQLCNADNHLFSLPDLQTVVSWIEDGRLRPDDQISRTGRHWLRLGEIAELSTIFVGFDGLPRLFKAIDTPPAPPASAGELGPPPPFGDEIEDIPPFGVGNAPSLDSPSQSLPASMLDAVTKAVSAPPKPREDEPEADAVVPRPSVRSQPILVSELAAAASTAAAAKPEASAAIREPSSPSGETTPTAAVPAASAVAAAEGSQTVDPAEAAMVAQQVAGLDEEPAKKGGLGWLALLGVAAGLVVMFGVPDIREKIFGGSTPTQATPVAGQPAAAAASVVDLGEVDVALQKLGLAETAKIQGALQKVIDDRQAKSQPVADVKAAQAEVILTRALAFKIAVSLDATAVNGTARSRADEDKETAAEIVKSIERDEITDAGRLQRVDALLALLADKPGDAAGLVPPGADELRLVVSAAPLWLESESPVPPGLIGGLQGLPQPTTLARSLLALALLRSGDDDGARERVAAVNQTVADQPLALTLDAVLRRALEEADAGDAGESAGAPEPADVGTTVRKPRPSGSGSGGDSVSGAPETLTPRGCDKVRGGDPTAGVKLLLAAIDANAMGIETYLCLGEGYMKMGNLGSSLSFYDRATKLAPKHAKALEGAASAAAKLNRTPQAIDYYKRLLAVDPGNEAAKAYLAKQGVKTDGGGSSGDGGGASAGGESGGGAPPPKDDSGDGGDDGGDDGGSPFLPMKGKSPG
ncbi:MAG: hypothetical protein H6710_08170 [Myxococcales bacterium]|nr:hypothetical protein [Myxococcales bacterium]